jgi:type I restriction enzyme R subunit
VDIGRPALSHFRLEKTGDLDVSLTPVGDQLLPGFAPDAGVAREAEEAPLSEVIEELNERFGLDLGTSDQLMLVQQIVSLAEDPQIRDLALMSDEDKYNQAAGERINAIVADNFERNSAFVNRYFADSDFQAAISQTTRRRAYNLINNPARDQALRELRAQARRTNG